MWWLVCLLLAPPGPSKTDVEPWLGRYVSGPETIGFRWKGGLIYDHGNIAVPVDGSWHVSVPEFHVRHRVTWLPGKGAVRLEESHDRSEAWTHELRLDGVRLLKVSMPHGPDESELLVRTFEPE